MTPEMELKAIEMALFFHNTYELLAPYFDYETRIETKYFDQNTPNGRLMIEVCKEWILKQEIEELKAKIK